MPGGGEIMRVRFYQRCSSSDFLILQFTDSVNIRRWLQGILKDTESWCGKTGILIWARIFGAGTLRSKLL
jgi:hypothetical protein